MTISFPAFTEGGALIEVRMTLDAGSEIVAIPIGLYIIDDDAATAAIAMALEDLRSRTTRNTAGTVARPVIDHSAEQGPLYLDEY